MSKGLGIILVAGAALVLAGCTSSAPQVNCELAEASGEELIAYEQFIDSLQDGFNLNFELLSIKSSILGYNTMGNSGCPNALTDLPNVKTNIAIEDGTYNVVYEKLTDSTYRLGVKSGEQIYYYGI